MDNPALSTSAMRRSDWQRAMVEAASTLADHPNWTNLVRLREVAAQNPDGARPQTIVAADAVLAEP